MFLEYFLGFDISACHVLGQILAEIFLAGTYSGKYTFGTNISA
jgi:hypothetical protein